jgi:thioredoxin 1
MDDQYLTPGPDRKEIDESQGMIALEFGTGWCGYCLGAAPAVKKALSERPEVKHVKVEDGPGRRLGRSFGVKLWPTLIFLKDGIEVARTVRPSGPDDIRAALSKLS